MSPPRLVGDEANFRQYFVSSKRAAKKRRLSFSLTSERFREITSSPCHFCGYPPSRAYQHNLKRLRGAPYMCHGIDRFDNKRGYEEGNVVPCCWICNRAKGSLTVEEFLLYALTLYNHSIKPALNEGYPDEATDRDDDDDEGPS